MSVSLHFNFKVHSLGPCIVTILTTGATWEILLSTYRVSNTDWGSEGKIATATKTKIPALLFSSKGLKTNRWIMIQHLASPSSDINRHWWSTLNRGVLQCDLILKGILQLLVECRWKDKQGGYCSNSGEDKMVPLTGMIEVQVVRNKSGYSCTWRAESNKSQCGSRPIMQRINGEICLHHFQLAWYKTLNFFSMDYFIYFI